MTADHVLALDDPRESRAVNLELLHSRDKQKRRARSTRLLQIVRSERLAMVRETLTSRQEQARGRARLR